MAIDLVCTCGKKYRVKDSFAGRKMRCSACEQVITIPAAPDTYDLAEEEPAKLSSSAIKEMGRVYGAGLQSSEHPAKPAFGKGGKGRRLTLMRPIHLEVGGRDVIRIHGRRCDPVKLRIAVVLAIILAVISCFVLIMFSMIMVPCAAPGGLGWFLIILRLSNAINDDYLKLSPKGRVVYNDRKCWLSIEVKPDCWFSLYPVKGMLMFRKDRLVYEQTKRYLHSTIGDRLVAKS